MTKATHTGTCQCCGAMQKLPNGDLSKHGYTVDNGWFQGTCPGSGSMPFEQGKGLIESFIEQAEQTIIELTAKCEELESTTSGLAWRRSYRNYKECDYGQKDGYFWEQVEIIEIQEEDKSWTNFYWADLHGHDSIRKQRQAGAGNSIRDETLGDRIKHYNTIYANQFRKQIDQAKTYIIWQKNRVADWKPQPLTPIK